MEGSCSVLIISSSEKTAESVARCMPDFAAWHWERADSCAAAKRRLTEDRFDLLAANIKKPSDYAELCTLCGGEYVVAALLTPELYVEYAADAIGRGIAPLKKPLAGETARAAFVSLTAAAKKMVELTRRADGIRATMDDMKIITRAKLLLMDRLKMDEAAAHRYIEKQSMNMRISRRKVAEGIIGTYEM